MLYFDKYGNKIDIGDTIRFQPALSTPVDAEVKTYPEGTGVKLTIANQEKFIPIDRIAELWGRVIKKGNTP